MPVYQVTFSPMLPTCEIRVDIVERNDECVGMNAFSLWIMYSWLILGGLHMLKEHSGLLTALCLGQ